jgi:hypothetical protein
MAVEVPLRVVSVLNGPGQDVGARLGGRARDVQLAARSDLVVNTVHFSSFPRQHKLHTVIATGGKSRVVLT